MGENKLSDIFFFIREEQHGFLSNFERTPFIVDGIRYPTNEHYYQSQKANDPDVREWIKNAPHARIAMVFGRSLEHNKYLKDKFMVENWIDKKDDVMLKGLRHKFNNKPLAYVLLATGKKVLHENNSEDPYWGIGDGTGKSMLGKLLMQVRDEIREGIMNE